MSNCFPARRFRGRGMVSVHYANSGFTCLYVTVCGPIWRKFQPFQVNPGYGLGETHGPRQR